MIKERVPAGRSAEPASQANSPAGLNRSESVRRRSSSRLSRCATTMNVQRGGERGEVEGTNPARSGKTDAFPADDPARRAHQPRPAARTGAARPGSRGGSAGRGRARGIVIRAGGPSQPTDSACNCCAEYETSRRADAQFDQRAAWTCACSPRPHIMVTWSTGSRSAGGRQQVFPVRRAT